VASSLNAERTPPAPQLAILLSSLAGRRARRGCPPAGVKAGHPASSRLGGGPRPDRAVQRLEATCWRARCVALAASCRRRQSSVVVCGERYQGSRRAGSALPTMRRRKREATSCTKPWRAKSRPRTPRSDVDVGFLAEVGRVELKRMSSAMVHRLATARSASSTPDARAPRSRSPGHSGRNGLSTLPTSTWSHASRT